MNAFRQGMRELGYVEGQTFVLEPRYAALTLDRTAGSRPLAAAGETDR